MTCPTCPHCRESDGVKSDCELATFPVYIRVGKCPIGLFDNSGAKAAKEAAFVYICTAKRLNYSPEEWAIIAACPLVGSKHKVPREVFEAVKGMRA
jgi:hypothetical protein